AALERIELRLQCANFGIALEHFEASIEYVDAIVDGLQLGRLVHYMDRRGDLPAIVQHARDLQLVAIFLAHLEVCQGAHRGMVHGLREQHGELRYALTMPTRVR